MPSESAANAKTCAVAPSAESTCVTDAVTDTGLVADRRVNGDTATVAPVTAYARRPVIATEVALTNSPLDAAPAKMVTSPAARPFTVCPETATIDVSDAVNVALGVTSAPTSVVRPVPPRSASNRKRAVSNRHGASC